MYLSELDIEGYKGIEAKVTIPLHDGLNVLVGENASGKTTVVDAIRLLLREDEFGYTPISDMDFHNPVSKNTGVVDQFRLRVLFSDLLPHEKVAFLPWSNLNGSASLSLQVDKKESRGRYKRQVWGGTSQSSAFEWELFEKINCIYLPPLRDAEAKLRDGRTSRLARLLKNIEASEIKSAKDRGDIHPLEEEFKTFNQTLADDETGAIAKANKLIKERLKDAVGSVFGQDTQIQFSEVNFNRIVESLRLFFFPDIKGPTNGQSYRSLEENSLGYNNLLYLATVLAELIETPQAEEYLKILLIEEPEAHLHPQLQIRLLKYLEKTAEEKGVQVIVTTHSPVLASSASVRNVIHLSTNEGAAVAVPLRFTGIDKTGSEAFISRWLDATKSTLLFAKGVILVEGIAEALLVPVIAKQVLKTHNESLPPEDKLSDSLEDAGISVINMNGIYFKYFMQLFCNLDGKNRGDLSIQIRCSGITDRDPLKNIAIDEDKTEPSKPTPSNLFDGQNPAIKLVDVIAKSDNCRLFVSPLKTLEYDLAFEGNNVQIMAKILADNWHNRKDVYKELKSLSESDWSEEVDTEKGKAAYEILRRIEDNNMGKGNFAQILADQISSGTPIALPDYIREAIIWVCGRTVDEPPEES